MGRTHERQSSESAPAGAAGRDAHTLASEPATQLWKPGAVGAPQHTDPAPHPPATVPQAGAGGAQLVPVVHDATPAALTQQTLPEAHDPHADAAGHEVPAATHMAFPFASAPQHVSVVAEHVDAPHSVRGRHTLETAAVNFAAQAASGTQVEPAPVNAGPQHWLHTAGATGSAHVAAIAATQTRSGMVEVVVADEDEAAPRPRQLLHMGSTSAGGVAGVALHGIDAVAHTWRPTSAGSPQHCTPAAQVPAPHGCATHIAGDVAQIAPEDHGADGAEEEQQKAPAAHAALPHFAAAGHAVPGAAQDGAPATVPQQTCPKGHVPPLSPHAGPVGRQAAATAALTAAEHALLLAPLPAHAAQYAGAALPATAAAHVVET